MACPRSRQLVGPAVMSLFAVAAASAVAPGGADAVCLVQRQVADVARGGAAQSPLAAEYQKLQQYATVAYQQNVRMLALAKQYQAQDSELQAILQKVQHDKDRVERDVKAMFSEHGSIVASNRRLKGEFEEARAAARRLQVEASGMEEKTRAWRGGAASRSHSISQLLDGIQGTEKDSATAYAENQELRGRIKALSVAMANLTEKLRSSESARTRWQAWLSQLSGWNAKLQKQIQENVPERLRVEMQGNMNRLGKENEELRREHSKLTASNTQLASDFQHLMAEIGALNGTSIKLLEEKNQIETSYNALLTQHAQLEASMKKTNDVGVQQNGTLAMLQKQRSEDGAKYEEERTRLQRQVDQAAAAKGNADETLSKYQMEQDHLLNQQLDLAGQKQELRKEITHLRTISQAETDAHSDLSKHVRQLISDTQAVEAEKKRLADENLEVQNKLGGYSGLQKRMLSEAGRLKVEKQHLENELLEGKRTLERRRAELGAPSNEAEKERDMEAIEQEKNDIAAKIGELVKSTAQLAPPAGGGATGEAAAGGGGKLVRLSDENKNIKLQLGQNVAREKELLDSAEGLVRDNRELETHLRSVEDEKARLEDAAIKSDPKNTGLSAVRGDLETLTAKYAKARKQHDTLLMEKV